MSQGPYLFTACCHCLTAGRGAGNIYLCRRCYCACYSHLGLCVCQCWHDLVDKHNSGSSVCACYEVAPA